MAYCTILDRRSFFCFCKSKVAHTTRQCCCPFRATMCSGMAAGASFLAKKRFCKKCAQIQGRATFPGRCATTGRAPGGPLCVCVCVQQHWNMDAGPCKGWDISQCLLFCKTRFCKKCAGPRFKAVQHFPGAMRPPGRAPGLPLCVCV